MSVAPESPTLHPRRLLDHIDRKRTEVSDQRALHVLHAFEEHSQAVYQQDLARVLRTFVPEPRFRFWGPQPQAMQPFAGLDATSRFYEGLFAMGQGVEQDFGRLLVDDQGLLAEGISKTIVPGILLQGVPHLVIEAAIEPERLYVSMHRTALVVGFDDDLRITTQDFYSDGGHRILRAG